MPLTLSEGRTLFAGVCGNFFAYPQPTVAIFATLWYLPSSRKRARQTPTANSRNDTPNNPTVETMFTASEERANAEQYARTIGLAGEELQRYVVASMACHSLESVTPWTAEQRAAYAESLSVVMALENAATC